MNKRIINQYITAKADKNVGELWIYGDITDIKWYDEDVTPKDIRTALEDMGSIKTLNIRVNSYGGSVFAGNAIFNIIDGYRRKTGVTVDAYIDGIAASMGSGIPMVADKIYMAENAMFMLHKPLSFAYGNANDFEKAITMLDKAEETLLSNYKRHFNGTEDQLRQMLSDETWLTAEEALEYGLCDEIITAVTVAASANGIIIDGTKFTTAYSSMKNKYTINKKEDNNLKYDKSLEKYGITEDVFNGFGENVLDGVCSAILNGVSDSMKNAATATIGEDGKYHVTNSVFGTDIDMVVDVSTTDSFITSDKATEVLGNEYTADEVLDFAKIGMDVDTDAQDKAKAYDEIRNTAIDKAIQNGLKAKETFDEDRWRKILSNMTYKEILDQSAEWENDAKIALNAGNRVSEPYKPTAKESNSVNPNDYNF